MSDFLRIGIIPTALGVDALLGIAQADGCIMRGFAPATPPKDLSFGNLF